MDAQELARRLRRLPQYPETVTVSEDTFAAVVDALGFAPLVTPEGELWFKGVKLKEGMVDDARLNEGG